MYFYRRRERQREREREREKEKVIFNRETHFNFYTVHQVFYQILYQTTWFVCPPPSCHGFPSCFNKTFVQRKGWVAFG